MTLENIANEILRSITSPLGIAGISTSVLGSFLTGFDRATYILKNYRLEYWGRECFKEDEKFHSLFWLLPAVTFGFCYATQEMQKIPDALFNFWSGLAAGSCISPLTYYFGFIINYDEHLDNFIQLIKHPKEKGKELYENFKEERERKSKVLFTGETRDYRWKIKHIIRNEKTTHRSYNADIEKYLYVSKKKKNLLDIMRDIQGIFSKKRRLLLFQGYSDYEYIKCSVLWGTTTVSVGSESHDSIENVTIKEPNKLEIAYSSYSSHSGSDGTWGPADLTHKTESSRSKGIMEIDLGKLYSGDETHAINYKALNK